MLTPVGVLGGLRGTLFVNMGGGGFNGQDFIVAKSGSSSTAPSSGTTSRRPIYGPEFLVDGFRLVDSRASYGISLQSALLGFPMHFDWSWRTLFNRDWEDLLFAGAALAADPSGFTRGSDLFRKVKFSFWIGYDF
jgi:hypothetical protein